MGLLQARVKITAGNGKVITKDSLTLLTYKAVNEILVADFTADVLTYVYRTTQPYGPNDVNAYDLWELLGYCEDVPFKAVHTFDHFYKFSANLGTANAPTLIIDGFSHTIRWLFQLSDVYDEVGHSQEYSLVGTLLDLPTNKFKSVTLDITAGETTRRGVFTPFDATNPAKGYICVGELFSGIYSEIDSKPMSVKVISWVLA